MSDRTIPGPLLSQVGLKPNLVERIASNRSVELYRSPNTESDADPGYLMVTNDHVLTTFGETGLVATVERIDEEGRRHIVVDQDGHGRYHLDPENLPIDGIKRNRGYSDEQHLGLVLDYVYNKTRELPRETDERLERFHDLTGERAIARFLDYSSLISEQDIVPDYSHRTNIVTVSHGCRYSCRFCPEGGGIDLYTPEHIRENMRIARELQQKYHQGLEQHMDEGFINTSDILFFALLKESKISPEEILDMYLDFFPEGQKVSTFMDIRNILEYSKDVRFRGMVTANNLTNLRLRSKDHNKRTRITRSYVGIETAHDIASRFLGKNITYEEKKTALSLLNQAGYRVKAIIQVGALGQGFYKRREDIGKEKTPENFVSSMDALKRTVALMEDTRPYRIMISSFVPLKHLPLIDDPRRVPYEDGSEVKKEIDFVVGSLSERLRSRIELSYEQFVEGRQRRVKQAS